ncbi:TRAP transporter substrate-binding protein [Melaminivora sp.]
MNARNIALAALTALALPAMAQEVTLKIAHFLPSAAPAQQKVLQPWCEDLKKDSGGRIQCQFYPAMQLGGTPAQLADQVKNGVADVAWTAPGYSAGRFPAIEAFELPFMVKDSSSSSKALWQYYQQHAQQEFAAYKVLGFHTDGGQAVHTAGKPVAELKDFSGLKLRTSTRVGARTLTALGGSPVAMPPAQVTEAIAKGVVDGALGAWELVFPTKLSEVTKFHMQPEAGAAYPTATVLTVLMNKKKYDGLPADLKAVLDKHSGEALTNRFGRVFDEVAEDSRKRVAGLGNKITTLNAAQVAALQKATTSVDEEWAKQVSEKGLDGKKLLAAARALSGTDK